MIGRCVWIGWREPWGQRAKWFWTELAGTSVKLGEKIRNWKMEHCTVLRVTAVAELLQCLIFFCSFNEIKWIYIFKKPRVVDTWHSIYTGLSESLTWLDKHATAAGMNGIAASKILLELVRPSLSLKLILLNLHVVVCASKGLWLWSVHR